MALGEPWSKLRRPDEAIASTGQLQALDLSEFKVQGIVRHCPNTGGQSGIPGDI
jgi:hypothetical protein